MAMVLLVLMAPAPLVAAQAEPLAARAQPQAVSAHDPQQTLRLAQIALLPSAIEALADLDWGSAGYAMPVSGRLSSPFGWRNISVNGNRFHSGVDLAASSGTPVLAARSGRVTRAGWWGSYGNAVAIEHLDGSETRYAHMSSLAVRAGQTLRQGDVIGAVGSTGASTGPHLHFEIRLAGHAVDPLPYLRNER